MKCRFQATDGAPEQFVLQRLDTARFCCVTNKCLTRTGDKFEKCYVVVFNMTKFIPNKELSWTTLIITLRSLACPIAGYMWTMVSVFQKWLFRCCRQGTAKKQQHCWTKMICKHRNNSPNNWTLVNKLFPIGHKRWEILRRLIDGSYRSWTADKSKSSKTHATFCSLSTKGIRFYIV